MAEAISHARLVALAAELRAAGYTVSRADEVIPRATAVLLASNAAVRHGRAVKKGMPAEDARECRARASAAAALAAELGMYGKARSV